MTKNSTHLLIDGEKIIISSDIKPIFEFLIEIEKEVQNFLDFDKKLEKIQKQHRETLGLVGHLVKKLKENDIDFDYHLSEDPKTIIEKLKFEPPIRSQLIVLFAEFSTLFCLYIAYENETSDEQFIRDKANKKNLEKFIEKYFLTGRNQWYQDNKPRSSKISPTQLVYLRNSLTHFFSLSESLSIIPHSLSEKARKMEILFEKDGHKAIFISPQDLYEIIKYSVELLLKEWSDDCLNDSKKFKRRISFVQSIVEKNGAIIVSDKNINL